MHSILGRRLAAVAGGAILLVALLPGSVAAAVGPATQLVFTTQPTTTSFGAIIPDVTVSVEDASNAVVTTSTATVALSILANPGGGTLSGTVSVAAANGVATFSDLSIDNAGVDYTLVATSTGLTGATSATFTIVGAASKLAFTAQPSSTSVNTSIAPPVTVTVEDVNNQTVDHEHGFDPRRDRGESWQRDLGGYDNGCRDQRRRHVQRPQDQQLRRRVHADGRERRAHRSDERGIHDLGRADAPRLRDAAVEHGGRRADLPGGHGEGRGRQQPGRHHEHGQHHGGYRHETWTRSAFRHGDCKRDQRDRDVQ